jgi:ABC-type transport system involved in cytochrome c biogenesis permease subunit
MFAFGMAAVALSILSAVNASELHVDGELRYVLATLRLGEGRLPALVFEDSGKTWSCPASRCRYRHYSRDANRPSVIGLDRAGNVSSITVDDTPRMTHNDLLDRQASKYSTSAVLALVATALFGAAWAQRKEDKAAVVPPK